MWARVHKWLLAAAISAAVVGGCVGVDRVLPAPASPRDTGVEVYGAYVFYDTNTRFPLDPVALRRAFEAAATYWGTKPEAIAGWVLIQRNNDVWVVGDTAVWGVSFMDLKRMDFATPRPDCPELVFVHEWGHAGADIGHHEDERFDDALILAFLRETGVCR